MKAMVYKKMLMSKSLSINKRTCLGSAGDSSENVDAPTPTPRVDIRFFASTEACYGCMPPAIAATNRSIGFVRLYHFQSRQSHSLFAWASLLLHLYSQAVTFPLLLPFCEATKVFTLLPLFLDDSGVWFGGWR